MTRKDLRTVAIVAAPLLVLACAQAETEADEPAVEETAVDMDAAVDEMGAEMDAAMEESLDGEVGARPAPEPWDPPPDDELSPESAEEQGDR